MTKKITVTQNVSIFTMAFILLIGTMFSFATLVSAADTEQPRIVVTVPANNAQNVPTDQKILVQFTEAMDPTTITTNTIILVQRTTPHNGSLNSEYRERTIQGTVTYSGVSATFTPTNPLQPSQIYGNVFTLFVTTGVQDLAGNSLAREYIISFTTGTDSFVTGGSTAQINQAPTIGTNTPTTTPVTTPTVSPVTTQNTSESSNFPWYWVIGGLIVAMIIALLVGGLQTSKKQHVYKTTNKASPVVAHTAKIHSEEAFGDIQQVSDVQGIGPEYTQRLKEQGITNTKELWDVNASRLANAIDVPVQQVHSWQSMAELMSVHAIGPQYAELLERSGVRDIKHLKSFTPAKLLSLVQKKQNALKINIQGNTLGHAIVSNWIDEARVHKRTVREAST